MKVNVGAVKIPVLTVDKRDERNFFSKPHVLFLNANYATAQKDPHKAKEIAIQVNKEFLDKVGDASERRK
jgi:hypothetical protein